MLVVKVGGGTGVDLDSVCDDVASICAGGEKMILVHGGSGLLDEVSAALGHPPQFVTSPSGYTSRWTDSRTMEIFQMVYCGRVNKSIVQRLQNRGVNAIGLCGMDGRIWTGPRKDVLQVMEQGRRRILRGNLTGRVDHVNVELLQRLLDADLLPVLTPPALADDGQPINVDGDRAAARTAVALQATDLVILSNVPGLLADIEDSQSIVPQLHVDEVEAAAERFATGRMRIKLLGASEAVKQGVGRVIIGDSRRPYCIQQALAGSGTLISHQANPLPNAAGISAS